MLIQKVPQILQHITANAGLVAHNKKLFDIHGGKLLPYLIQDIQDELTVPSAVKGTIAGLPHINIIQRVTSKLSKVYVEPASRTSESETDDEILENYEVSMSIDEQMASANVLLNLQKYVSIEPYVSGNSIKIRIVPAHQHLVWSDSSENPHSPTVFIKFMGVAASTNKKDAVVSIYHLYSDTEFLIVDSEGEYRADLMGDREPVNYLGMLPFIYISLDKYRLLPEADEGSYQMQMLIPKQLASLNYASKMLSHSLHYIIDGEPSSNQLEATPDSVWLITSNENGKSASIGNITPSVDSDRVLRLVGQQLSMWLETRNIKTSSTGVFSVNTAASGISKLIDESDASAEIQRQSLIFAGAEQRLWHLVATLHNWSTTQNLLKEKRKFSTDFAVSIKHGQIQPFISELDRTNQIKTKLDAGLISKRMAVSQANPELTDDQVTQLLEEMKAEKEAGH